jgi:hypothetical protein
LSQMIKKLNTFLFTFPLEGYIWIAAILGLAFINVDGVHFSICPFHNLGIEFCPGCGLGRSIHYFISFEFTKSFNAHPLGGAALAILLYRVFYLMRGNINSVKNGNILIRR